MCQHWMPGCSSTMSYAYSCSMPDDLFSSWSPCLTLIQLAYSCSMPTDLFLSWSMATSFRISWAAPIKVLKKLSFFFRLCLSSSLSLLFSGSQWWKVQDKSALIRMLGVPTLNHAQFHLVKAVWTLARKQRQVLKIKVMFTSMLQL